MNRYVCIHGHFYQPPRENPWLEEIELQDSARPFHDWNERITGECYAPNARARILNQSMRIWKIVNNYAALSFNFGPTLLRWMDVNAPEAYAATLEADRVSQQRFGGHGSAIAQGFHHAILPLCNDRDRLTQVRWGVADFKHRFKRAPQGIWLPETAVNAATLETLAEHNLAFTILAPRQAARVRKLGGGRWKNVHGAKIDPSRAYLARLPSGRSINLFFYDGPVSQAVAFEKLLNSGDAFAQRLLSAFSDQRDWPQLAHIATDGESYGHHHRQGEMALAYAMHQIESTHAATIINYGQFLELHPPTHEVQIIDNSSWSCAHGVERWKSDCGCSTGGNPSWNQQWRAPLRAALDWLRDTLGPRYEQACAPLLRDCWEARNDYVAVVLDRSPGNVQNFLDRHSAKSLCDAERVQALKLLEMQRHLMLMYTSCGWFFDELTGIETVQVLRYAARAIQLGQELFDSSIEEGFLEQLQHARSNISAHGDGRQVYRDLVKPAIVDLKKVAAHFTISSLFEEYEQTERVFAYDIEREGERRMKAGQATLTSGIVKVTSSRTLESQRLRYGVLHMGDHMINAGIGAADDSQDFEAFRDAAAGAFDRADLAEVLRLLDRHFQGSIYSIQSLFADEQHKILQRVLEHTMSELESDYRRMYDHHAPLIRFLRSINQALPRALQLPADFVVNTDIRKALAKPQPDVEAAASLMQSAAERLIRLDHVQLAYEVGSAMARVAYAWRKNPNNLEVLSSLHALSGLAAMLQSEVDASRAQNIYYELMQSTLPHMRDRAAVGDEGAHQWLAIFIALGEKLSMEVS